jgi:DNA-binding MarR family transcriptional regulator
MLDELGPTTVGELARADRTSQPTATAAVNALVERGWGARTPHPRDARSSLVEMTDTGRAVLAGARREYGAMLADRLPPYTAEDLRTATALIKHLLENHT